MFFSRNWSLSFVRPGRLSRGGPLLSLCGQAHSPADLPWAGRPVSWGGRSLLVLTPSGIRRDGELTVGAGTQGVRGSAPYKHRVTCWKGLAQPRGPPPQTQAGGQQACPTFAGAALQSTALQTVSPAAKPSRFRRHCGWVGGICPLACSGHFRGPLLGVF